MIASLRPRCSAAFHCCVDRACGLALAPPADVGFFALELPAVAPTAAPALSTAFPLTPPPLAAALGLDSSSSTVVGELLCRFSARSSDADESPLSHRR